MTATPRVDYFLDQRSLTGKDDECGDGGVVIEDDDQCFLGLVDVLGHGKEAHEVCLRAQAFMTANHRLPLVELMEGLHAHIRNTRGAVAAVCQLDKRTGELRYVGIGNINVRIFGTTNHVFIPRDGIVGYTVSRPREQMRRLYPGDILAMTSDGLREHFSLHDYPQLLSGSARQIVQRMINYLGKSTDDASCLVLRYGI